MPGVVGSEHVPRQLRGLRSDKLVKAQTRALPREVKDKFRNLQLRSMLDEPEAKLHDTWEAWTNELLNICVCVLLLLWCVAVLHFVLLCNAALAYRHSK